MAVEATANLTGNFRAGEFRTAGQAEVWLNKMHSIELRINSIHYQLGMLVGRLKFSRPCHLKKDEEAASTFKAMLVEKMKGTRIAFRL